MEPIQGDPWPEERAGHAACCLNYNRNNPIVLVSGGLSMTNRVLRDLWILDVDYGKWKEVRASI